MQDEIIELQSKLSFQEQTINELNNALVSQQQQIDHLQQKIKLLEDTLTEVDEQAGLLIEQGQHEKPPHY
jgi:SlyX protein